MLDHDPNGRAWEDRFRGFDVVTDEDGDQVWVMVPSHSIENLAIALELVDREIGERYTHARERWALEHTCPDDCEDCTVEHAAEVSRRDEAGEDVDDVPDCFCHAFDGSGIQFIRDAREGADPAYEIDLGSHA